MLVIRLFRTGKKNQPFFKIVVTDKRNPPKGGRFVEKIGYWNPLTKEKEINSERVKYWISQGAQPSDTIHNFLIDKKIIEGKKITKHSKAKKKKIVASSEQSSETKEAKVEPKAPPQSEEKPLETPAESPEKEETKKEDLVEESKESKEVLIKQAEEPEKVKQPENKKEEVQEKTEEESKAIDVPDEEVKGEVQNKESKIEQKEEVGELVQNSLEKDKEAEEKK